MIHILKKFIIKILGKVYKNHNAIKPNNYCYLHTPTKVFWLQNKIHI